MITPNLLQEEVKESKYCHEFSKEMQSQAAEGKGDRKKKKSTHSGSAGDVNDDGLGGIVA